MISRPLKQIATEVNSVANTAFYLYKSKGEISLVFEGLTDRKFWLRFIQVRECRVEIVGDKANVIEIADIVDKLLKRFPQYASNASFAVGVVDVDYDVPHKMIHKSNSLRYVQLCPNKGNSRDLEVVMLRSEALRDYLLQEDLEEATESIRGRLFSEGAKIGGLRLIASDPRLTRSPFGDMKELPWSEFYDQNKIFVDLPELTKLLCLGQRRNYAEVADFVARAEQATKSYSAEELCRGHDLMEMLAKHLEVERNRTFHPIEVEKDIRLAFGLSYALDEEIYRELNKWGLLHGKDILKTH